MIKKIAIQIDGIRCSSCISKLEKGFNSIQGIKKNFIDPISNQAFLHMDSSQIDLNQLKNIIHNLGYSIKTDFLPISINQKNFNIIQEHLNKKFDFINISYNRKVCEIEFLSTLISKEEIQQSLENLSIKVNFFQKKYFNYSSFKTYLSFILLSFLFLFHLKMDSLFINKTTSFYILVFITTLTQFFIGWPFIKGAFQAWRYKRNSMDTLITIGSLTAYFYSIYLWFQEASVSYFEASALIILFTHIGKWIEQKIKNKQFLSIERLKSFQKNSVYLYKNSEIYEISKSQVKKGDILFIKTFESIPFNGKIIRGESYIDESSVTGESYPKKVFPGQTVYQATFNQHNPIFIEITDTKKGLDELFNQIEKSKETKSSLHSRLDQVASIFVPFILLLSFFSFLFLFFLAKFQWIDIGNHQSPLELALLRSITLLVISCPCIIGLTIPMTIALLTNIATKSGIWVKNPSQFEFFNLIDLIVFDKTGTLSEGKMQIQSILIFDKKFKKKDILFLASLLENYSSHPIANIFLEESRKEKISTHLEDLSQFKIIDGIGIEGFFQGKHLAIGNNHLLEKYNIRNPLSEKVSDFNNLSLFLIYEHIPIAFFELYDPIRPYAPLLVQELKKNYELAILSGSNERDLKQISYELGINNFEYGMLPEDKKLWIENKQKKDQKKILMIGDGLNDIPAFIQANMSICLFSGQDNILTSKSDFVILKKDPYLLHKISFLLKVGKLGLKKIKMNIFWTFFYNSIAIPLAIFGIITPTIASFIMILSSLSITLNSTTLLFKKFKENE